MKLGRGGKHRTLSRSGASIRVLGGDLHYVAQVVQRMALMMTMTMTMMMMMIMMSLMMLKLSWMKREIHGELL